MSILTRRFRAFFVRVMHGERARGFDPDFYLGQYEDLVTVKGRKKALRHYLKHGESEGRFPNKQAYDAHAELMASSLHCTFDVVAYKFYNKDLLQHFDTDEQFFRHYVHHGHKEGRLCSFANSTLPEEILDDAQKWQAIFSTSDFLAWCGDELEALPTTRDEAIEIFCSLGIENLWPITLDHAFDPQFVRENDMLPEHADKSDPDLYRAWLAEGFPAFVAPNEQMFLVPYLGGVPFPLEFDWRAFARKTGMPRATTRSQALIALFELPTSKLIKHIDLMGKNAADLLARIGRRFLAQGQFNKSIVAFSESIAITPTAELLCLLGDCYRQIGAPEDALRSYLASTKMDRAPIWSFLHAAATYTKRNAFQEAFTVLRIAFPFWRHKVDFHTKLNETVQSYFDHVSARAHALYREISEQNSKLVERHAIDQLLIDALDQITAIYNEMGCLPAGTGGNPEGYVAILANDDLRQCTYYRIEQKARQFASANIPVRIFSHSDIAGFMNSLVGARAAIFYRVAATPAVLRAILYANAMKLDTYYEIDDLIFDSHVYPDPFASFEGQISIVEYCGLQFGVPLFRYAMSKCSAGIASTPALADRMREVIANGKVFVIRNGLDERNDAAILMGARPVRGGNGRLRVFYGSGTKAHNADFNRLVAPPLLKLMQQYAHIDLVIVGHLKLDPDLSGMGSRIITYPIITDMTTYWSVLANCDINIAVLEPSIVADCKSEIKWLEAAVLQIPSIVSGTQTYREIIDDGIDGFIADSVEDWYTALENLITQPRLREEVAGNARRKVLRSYDLEMTTHSLRLALGYRAAKSAPLKQERLRVLICNVFFAPQSYGGATRVVEDNVQNFVDSYSDLDIGVFCSNEGVSPPGSLSLSEELGVPVYRLSTPLEANMDWRPFNEDNSAPFERVIDHFKPDIIHFHCIQRLTATIVEVAHRRAIPYFVTLHDGWWICDNQFLINENGFLNLPGTDTLGDCALSNNPLASNLRRQRLASLLQAAEGNLSVSESFAEIYERAGIDRLHVVENGAPRIERITHASRSDGRVALGHVGGRAPHKGASLIEAVLRRHDYTRLHLTMVDGNLSPGQSIDTYWGNTPVTLTAPYPQSQVDQLYSRLNVLLAPSTWPESFGLVTREALDSGLWVVASKLGAIGKVIEDWRNGFLIDSTAQGLTEALARIDADADLYRSPPLACVRTRRTMADQAVELNTLYRNVSIRL